MVALQLVRSDRTWTLEDLDQLPEDGSRYEIVDGGLVVTPSPGVGHEGSSDTLRHLVRQALTPGLRVLGPVGLGFGRTYRTPDLVVVPDALVQQRPEMLAPADVLLVVEVMSPGSVTNDRITKPAQYADAGVPHYWRLEPGSAPDGSDAVLACYALRGAAPYVEVGVWRGHETADLTEPVDVRLVPSALR